MPSANDIFDNKNLNRQLDDHNSVWDIRGFFHHLMAAKGNSLELLFSSKAEYFDKNFQILMNDARARASSIVRNKWKVFTDSLYGMASSSVKVEKTPKSVARFLFLYFLHERVAIENKLDYSIWYSSYPAYEIARVIRRENRLTQVDLSIFEEVKGKWDSVRAQTPTLHDAIMLEQLDHLFRKYFSNHLTSR